MVRAMKATIQATIQSTIQADNSPYKITLLQLNALETKEIAILN